jgi:glycosyltransferase involved in cell wall biosynthesis
VTAPVGVLHVVQSLSLGGAERMAVELANRACRSRIRPVLASTRGDGPLRAEIGEDVPVLALDRTSRWDPRCFAAFRRFLREQRIQIVHSHGPGPLQYVAAALAPGALGCRHVFHDHHGRETARDPKPDLPTRLAFRLRLKAVIGVSRLACAWARERMGWPADRVFLLRNGIETERFIQASALDVRREFGLPQRCVIAAMVANFRWEKDHLTALRALARCPSRNNIRLLLVGGAGAGGGGDPEEARKAAGALGVEDLVVFTGARPDVPNLLAGSDVGLLTSQRESGPLVVLEYMAAGLPFVATRVGEIGGELPSGDIGFLVPPRDPDAAAGALERLAGLAPSERKRMGERGRALVRGEYDQSRTAERLLAIYEQVMRW